MRLVKVCKLANILKKISVELDGMGLYGLMGKEVEKEKVPESELSFWTP